MSQVLEMLKGIKSHTHPVFLKRKLIDVDEAQPMQEALYHTNLCVQS